MFSSAREMLDAIDSFLVEAPVEEARSLWDVLTALRGPDNGNDAVKDETTLPIRRTAFPKMAAMSREAGDANRTGAIFFPYYSSPTGFSDVVRTSRPDGHFFYHTVQAARALGLTVDSKVGRV